MSISKEEKPRLMFLRHPACIKDLFSCIWIKNKIKFHSLKLTNIILILYGSLENSLAKGFSHSTLFLIIAGKRSIVVPLKRTISLTSFLESQ